MTDEETGKATDTELSQADITGTVARIEGMRYPTSEELAADSRLDPNLPIIDAGITEAEAIKLGLIPAAEASDFSADIAAAADSVADVNPMNLMGDLTYHLGEAIKAMIVAHDAYAAGINSVYNRHVQLNEIEFIEKMHRHDFGFHSGKMVDSAKTLQAHFAHVSLFIFPYLENLPPQE